MACKGPGCKKKGATVEAPCKVCQLLDSDNKVKLTHYCKECGVYICDRCWNDPLRRIPAAVASATHTVVDTIKEVAEKIFHPKKKKDFPTDEFGKEDEIA